METDSQLQRDVVDELRFDVVTCKAEIGVAVGGGVVTLAGWVTLTGEVDWEHQRRAAEERVRGLTGVRGVFNHIVIRREPKISADDVRARIAEALGVRSVEDLIAIEG